MGNGPADRQLWDDAAFIQRVKAIAAARGRSLSDISLRAGMNHDFLARSAPRSGRSIEALLRIAAELKLPVCELIGVDHDRPAKRGTPDEALLIRLGFAADVAAHLYVSMSERGEMPNEAAALEIVETLIKMVKRQPPLQSGDVPPETGN